MQKVIKIFFNVSYIVSLAALVFLGSIISKVTDKKSQSNKDGRTVLGDNSSPNFLNSAFADEPPPPDGDVGDGGDDCDDDDDDDDDDC